MKKLVATCLLLCAVFAQAMGPSTAGKLFVNHSAGVGCTTYATFDPSNTGNGVSLSNGNLTMTSLGGANLNARSTIGKASGKWYWEFVIGSGTQERVGIANATFGATGGTPVGNDVNSWSYKASNGDKVINGNQTAYGSTWTTGDVIGFALNMDAGTLVMYKNNSVQNSGTPLVTGLSGTIYAIGGENINGASLTANFGATALTYSPPSGFTAGLCN